MALARLGQLSLRENWSSFNRSLSHRRGTTVSSFKLEKENGKREASDEWKTAKPFSEIPGPKILPVLGTTWQFLPIIGSGIDIYHLGLLIEKNYQKFGPIWKDVFPGMDIVFTVCPKDTEKLLRDEGRFPERPVFQSLMHYRNKHKDVFKSSGILLSNGDSWWRIRTKIQQPMLKSKNMMLYLPVMGQIADEFIQRIRLIRPENNEMNSDFINEMYRWALESAAAVALNTRLGCLSPNLDSDSEPQQMITAVGDTFNAINDLEFGIPIWKYIELPALKKLFRAQDIITKTSIKYVDKVIESMKETERDAENVGILEGLFLHGLNREDVIVLVVDLLTAAIDTTSHSMAFMLYLLSRNPDKQEKLREHIFSLLPTKEIPVTPAILNELHYLKACIKESLRLLPVTAGIARITREDIVLSGYQIPKGTNIITLNQLMSKQRDHFENSERYLPERWLKGHPLENTAHPYVMLPFGHGTRMCIGRRLAEIEMWQLTIKLMQNFRVDYQHEDMSFISRSINTPDQPLRFKFTDLN